MTCYRGNRVHDTAPFVLATALLIWKWRVKLVSFSIDRETVCWNTVGNRENDRELKPWPVIVHCFDIRKVLTCRWMATRYWNLLAKCEYVYNMLHRETTVTPTWLVHQTDACTSRVLLSGETRRCSSLVGDVTGHVIYMH